MMIEPLTALSFAGNVIQFVQFAVSLVTGTRKILVSSTGLSDDSQRLEDVYTKLSELGSGLKMSNTISIAADSSSGFSESKHEKALEELAEICKKDCDQLLNVVSRLRAKKGNKTRWWDSFKTALLEVWAENEIDRFTKRITETQQAMTLLLCKISGYD
jgi:hypothetical protein